MKYFTPELLVRFSSSDEAVALPAHGEWEIAMKRYRRHYNKIKCQLPEAVRQFHDECCLHDAQVFGPARLSRLTIPWGFQDIILVAHNVNTLVPEHLNTVFFLQYAVATEPLIDVPVRDKLFLGGEVIWQHDEIDVVEPGVFSHEILISDGRVVKILFREFNYQIAPLLGPTQVSQLHQPVPDRAASA